MPHAQLDLFAHVACAYAEAPAGVLNNDALYRAVAQRAGISYTELDAKAPIGRTGQPRSLIKRKIRWFQQSLKDMGVLSRVEGERGVWRLCEAAGGELLKAAEGVKLVAFSTDLGVAIWGSNTTILRDFRDPIHLMISSPPYPLIEPGAYGNPVESEYIDFISRSLEPVVRNLVPGGSICLNLGNDHFLPGSPARSLYREKLLLTLCERFSLALMDRCVWSNPSKPPGPIQWASKKRVQLAVGYEVVYWLTNAPDQVRSDNRRVLEPHTERHKQLMARGGEQRQAQYGDGAYRLRHGSFGAVTEGRIPRNVITRGHACKDTRAYRADATRLGLPIHGAMQPLSIPDFFIRFLTEPGDLVVDIFGGTVKTGMAAERNGRRWLVCELMAAYLRASAERFRSYAGFCMDPGFEAIRRGAR